MIVELSVKNIHKIMPSLENHLAQLEISVEAEIQKRDKLKQFVADLKTKLEEAHNIHD